MKYIQFKCTLLSDIILNRKSASEGANNTLDFIPGNNFLGLVAAHYKDFGPDALEVFHSGHIRFGDAHPAGSSGCRTLRAAASLFYPKLHGDSSTYYNFHLLPDPSGSDTKALQLKQCRSGFYDYSLLPPVRTTTVTQFSIKSAYDSEKRRSKDNAMFGYEALLEGLVLFFEVEGENEALLNKIAKYLVGEKRLGRSRSAQYGLVKIEPCSFLQIPSTGETFSDNLYTVYADGRIIILDDNGIPSFMPKAKDLGFLHEDARIVWDKSQIRTFQYAPYNGIRKCFDSDRCGIEKGSVFVVESPCGSPSESAYIGCFNNEGFGRVIYNPAFLAVEDFTDALQSNGICHAVPLTLLQPSVKDTTFVKMLKEKHNQEIMMATIYRVVNEWAQKNKSVFADESFASQWGSIRSIAAKNRTANNLRNALFKNDKNCPGYLMHGISEGKWTERRRRFLLETFISDRSKDTPGYEWLAVINLATVMAKFAKK